MTTTPCSEAPERWFSTTKADQTYAIAGCRRCPRMQACQQDALDNDIRWGTWGGLTEKARRKPLKRVKKSETPAACGTSTAYWRHVNNKQTCHVCDAWHTAEVEAGRRRALAEEHAKGGSRRGYEIHRRLREQPCESCRRAHAQMLADRRQQRARTLAA
ncbi:WhiB family transcriptional regulator [Streptomyces sp. SP18ES09]|uniref:WhiB family transcriptional regulator n=1 Tax=Streptomyces sp. SP18ES09 TaxID=3002532 RepID=UPI002E76B5B6|nr:WhiB family transcriptional regulator [Streptomyces sp. SP18ES09]MEE1817998.1 WhiB family transcriptional regulator [Streptomyces sp. SP18ES09]